MIPREAEIAVIGGGLGGVAAALAAAEAGRSVLLAEETDRLGGQVTSQGVSCLDEHPHIERFGGTRSYYRLREGVRAFYRDLYGAPSTMPDGAPLNPGNGWVSRLCFEPAVGRRVIEEVLAPHVSEGRISVLTNHVPDGAVLDGDRVVRVDLHGPGGATVPVEADMYLDATELGDLLPMVGAPTVTGAEARTDTGEPHGRAGGPDPGEVQAFTFSFAVEHRPGEDHTIPKPPGYERLRDFQPFSLETRDAHGDTVPYRMFEVGPTGQQSFWTYRRLRDGRFLDPSGDLKDVALINWPANDYREQNLLDASPERRREILDKARHLSLSFLYWLQTEAPRDDGRGGGYPGLRLLREVMDTPDGLSRFPYVRESRRLRARTIVREQDVVPAGDGASRAKPFPDSVGVGLYHLDLHSSVGNPDSLYEPALPFQIPLGALVPPSQNNVLAASKNIGTTHLTGGAYRVHPVEWNIGEAAGAASAFCVEHGLSPGALASDPGHVRRLQRRLLSRGVPLFWFIDLPEDDPLFVPAQLLGAAGVVREGDPRWSTLEARPDLPLRRREARRIVRTAGLVATSAGAGPSASGIADVNADEETGLASAAEVESLLSTLSIRPPRIEEPPSWGTLCAALKGPMDEWLEGTRTR